jgi:hypothetical protein
LVCYRHESQLPGTRCTSCARKKKGCTNVVGGKSAGSSKKKGKSPEIEEEAEEEVIEESPPPEKKGKGIMGALKSLNKRTLSDRSPEEAPSPSKPRRRFNLVGVIVPNPPLPHSEYIQLPSLSSNPPSVVPSAAADIAPPLSSSPSLASFHSTASDQSYEIERLKLLLNASQEDLSLQRQEFENREHRLQNRFDAERKVYEARIRSLQGGDRGEGGSGSRRG